jgi:hypothetical protein
VARSGPRTIAIKCVGDENAGADECEKYCNGLSHSRRPLRSHLERNDKGSRTVKRIPSADRKSGVTDDFEQQRPSVARSRPCENSAAIRNAVGCQRNGPGAGGGTWGRLTELPTEGGWFLAGCSVRSTPPSADSFKPQGRESFPRNLCGPGGLVPHDNLASHLPVRRALRADRVPFGPARGGQFCLSVLRAHPGDLQ